MHRVRGGGVNRRETGGVGLFGLLGLLFIGLKLGGAIGWSWWWVLAPFWGPIALVVPAMIGVFLMAGWIATR